MYPKKNKKGSKAKADSHRTTPPKDYGIMAGQIRWLPSPGYCIALPPFGTYSVSFWFFRLSALIERLSFFSVFFFWKQFYEGGTHHQPPHSPQNNGFVLLLYNVKIISSNSSKWCSRILSM